MPKGFIDFDDLNPTQQAEVLDWLGGVKAFNQGAGTLLERVKKHAFRLKADGTISRSYVDRLLTDQALLEMANNDPFKDWHLHGNRPDKGDLNHLKSERFTMTPEK